MESGRFLKAPEHNETMTDKYTASIELSNACRQFYKSRVEAAQCIKSRWERHANTTRGNDNDRPIADTTTGAATTSTRRQRNSIDEAMDKLRTEMTCLMEQDLSLMRQLLTLNETIEELKWQRRYYHTSRSPPSSSTDLHASDCSLSDQRMSESDESLHPQPTTHTTTTTTCPVGPIVVLSTPSSSSRTFCAAKSCPAYECVSDKLGAGGPVVKTYLGEQNSFDSGIHEHSSEEEASV